MIDSLAFTGAGEPLGAAFLIDCFLFAYPYFKLFFLALN